jgi:peptide methionine sulfoxide reductase MsrB
MVQQYPTANSGEVELAFSNTGFGSNEHRLYKWILSNRSLYHAETKYESGGSQTRFDDRAAPVLLHAGYDCCDSSICNEAWMANDSANLKHPFRDTLDLALCLSTGMPPP